MGSKRVRCPKCNELVYSILTHHKDGNEKNNSPENLERMCRYCHAKIHHRKGRYNPIQRDISRIGTSKKLRKKLNMLKEQFNFSPRHSYEDIIWALIKFYEKK